MARTLESEERLLTFMEHIYSLLEHREYTHLEILESMACEFEEYRVGATWHKLRRLLDRMTYVYPMIYFDTDDGGIDSFGRMDAWYADSAAMGRKTGDKS